MKLQKWGMIYVSSIFPLNLKMTKVLFHTYSPYLLFRMQEVFIRTSWIKKSESFEDEIVSVMWKCCDLILEREKEKCVIKIMRNAKENTLSSLSRDINMNQLLKLSVVYFHTFSPYQLCFIRKIRASVKRKERTPSFLFKKSS